MRVLVTRPEPGATATAARLAALGHEPLVAPVTRIRATGAPPPETRCDALVVTSANAIPAMTALSVRRTMPVYAVGRRTAGRIAATGFLDVTWRDDAAALAAEMAGRLPPGSALLHVAGRDGRAEPAATLAAAGFALTVWEVYAAEALDRLPPAIVEALDGERLDAALHYSPRSAAILCRLVAEADRPDAFRGLAHLCISREVADEIATTSRGIAIHVANSPDELSILALLDLLGSRAPQSRC